MQIRTSHDPPLAPRFQLIHNFSVYFFTKRSDSEQSLDVMGIE